MTDDAKRFADQMGIRLFETSAKDNINVEEMFRAITELVLKSKKVSPSPQPERSKCLMVKIFNFRTRKSVLTIPESTGG